MFHFPLSLTLFFTFPSASPSTISGITIHLCLSWICESLFFEVLAPANTCAPQRCSYPKIAPQDIFLSRMVLPMKESSNQKYKTHCIFTNEWTNEQGRHGFIKCQKMWFIGWMPYIMEERVAWACREHLSQRTPDALWPSTVAHRTLA